MFAVLCEVQPPLFLCGSQLPALCIHDNCILHHQYSNLLKASKLLLLASHDRYCDVMYVTLKPKWMLHNYLLNSSALCCKYPNCIIHDITISIEYRAATRTHQTIVTAFALVSPKFIKARFCAVAHSTLMHEVLFHVIISGSNFHFWDPEKKKTPSDQEWCFCKFLHI